MAKKLTKRDRSQRQSDRSEKRLSDTRREAAKRNAREDVNQAVQCGSKEVEQRWSAFTVITSKKSA
jgi:hypothetical protein